jgi:hypothetical protein
MELFIALATIFIFVGLIGLSILFIASWVIHSLLADKKSWVDYGLDEEE